MQVFLLWILRVEINPDYHLATHPRLFNSIWKFSSRSLVPFFCCWIVNCVQEGWRERKRKLAPFTRKLVLQFKIQEVKCSSLASNLALSSALPRHWKLSRENSLPFLLVSSLSLSQWSSVMWRWDHIAVVMVRKWLMIFNFCIYDLNYYSTWHRTVCKFCWKIVNFMILTVEVGLYSREQDLREDFPLSLVAKRAICLHTRRRTSNSAHVLFDW